MASWPHGWRTGCREWPPRDTVQRLRQHVRAELPGADISLLMLGRVLIVWRAPGQ